MSTVNVLPQGYESLLPFVDKWACKTSQERLYARATSSMEEIKAFYDAAVARADEALTYVEQFPLDKLPPDAARLFCLVLSLAQAAMAVEVHGRARAPNTPFPNGIRITQGPAYYG
jgi:hypothetical protein